MLTFESEELRNGFIKYYVNGLPQDAVIHEITQVDGDIYHSHPWGFRSLILWGSYTEEILFKSPRGNYYTQKVVHKQGDLFRVESDCIHRIVELPEGKAFTLVYPEKWAQQPGFYRKDEAGVWYRQWNDPEFKLINQ